MNDTIEIGDLIQFKVQVMWPTKTEWRTVNGFWCGDKPTVRCYGHPNFIIRRSEIYAIIKKEDIGS